MAKTAKKIIKKWTFVAVLFVKTVFVGTILFYSIKWLYSAKLYIDITTATSFALYTCVLFTSAVQLVNGAEFFKHYLFLFLSVKIAAASAPCPTRVMVPLTSRYASHNHIKLTLFITSNLT